MRSAANQDKRQLIMSAAERLSSDRRFHEITLDEVARAAGVGKGTIYLYFADKDDLFLQVATSGFTELCAIVERGAPTGLPFRDGLLEVCRQISAFFLRRRQLLRMMQTEDGRLCLNRGAMREHWLAHRRRLAEGLGRILAAGVQEGVIRADLAPEVLAAFLLGMLRTRTRELEDPEAMPLAAVIGLFLQGAAAATPAGRAAGRTEGRQS